MRITDVRAVQPASPGCPPDWRTVFGQILVAIDTDAGLTGYGVGGGGLAGVHTVTRLLRDLLLGHDPAAVEEHAARMQRAVLPFGRKGLAIMALSGVDLALWDLRGKAENLPVARLLAEAPHAEVAAYASLGAEPGNAVAEGYRAIKLHLPTGEQAGGAEGMVARVADARRIIGPDVRLMTDAFMKWDEDLALAVAGPFAELKVEWLEEPLRCDDLAGYARLMATSPVPIAGGEHEYLAAGFQELIDRRLHAVLQPDITWCGGLTELVKIYQMAECAGLRVCQHRGAEAWGLHAVAAFEQSDPLAEAGRTWLPWVLDAPAIVGGRVRVPDRPGFGIRIEEIALP